VTVPYSASSDAMKGGVGRKRGGSSTSIPNVSASTRLVMGVGGGHVSMYLIVVDVVTSRTALLEVANEGKK